MGSTVTLTQRPEEGRDARRLTGSTSRKLGSRIVTPTTAKRVSADETRRWLWAHIRKGNVDVIRALVWLSFPASERPARVKRLPSCLDAKAVEAARLYIANWTLAWCYA